MPAFPSSQPMTAATPTGATPMLREDDPNVPRSSDGLAFWNVHAPESQRTPVCPPWLAVCDAADRAQLALRDSEYEALSWAAVKATIQSNRLGDFKRWPSDLWRYRAHMEVCVCVMEIGGFLFLLLENGWLM